MKSASSPPSEISTARSVIQAMWQDGRGWILMFVALGWGLVLGTRFIFPVLFPYFVDAFDTSLSTLGLVYSLLWFCYAIGQFPSGILADRLGERLVLTLGLILSGAVLILISFSLSIEMLAGGLVIFGLASALYGPTRLTVMSDLYSRFDGTAIGITQAAGEAGNSVFPFIAASIAIYFSWWLGVLYVIPLFLIAAIGLWITMPARTSGSESAVDELSVDRFRYIFSNMKTFTIVTLVLVMAISNFALQAVTSFYPTYLIDVKGFDSVTTAALFSLLFICAIVIQPLFGAIGDTFDSYRTLLVVLTTFSLGLFLLPFVDPLIAVIPATILVSSFFAIPPIVIPRLIDALPPDMRGTGFGFLRSCYFGVAATGSLYMGLLADQGLFDESFLSLSALVLLSLALILLFRTQISMNE